MHKGFQRNAEPEDPLRYHLSEQLEIAIAVLVDYRKSGDPEALHNARISLRRFRALLRLFRKPLQATSAQKISDDLRSLLQLLGATRDQDVWLEILEHLEKDMGLAGNLEWSAFVSDHQQVCQSMHRKTRLKLQGRGAVAVLDGANALIASEVAGVVAGGTNGFTDYLAVRLYKSFRRILKKRVLPDEFTEGQLHRFRRKCRLMRYWTEFARAHLGKNGTPFLKSLQKFSSALGEARDAAAGMRRLKGVSSFWADEVRKRLAQRRKQALKDFRKEWKACYQKRSRLKKLYRQALQAAATNLVP